MSVSDTSKIKVIGVAGGHSQGHAALAGALEHVQQALGEGVLAVIVDVAAVGAQAQVGHVHAQQDAVLQSGQNVRIGRAAGGLEHVHVDDLGLGSHAHDGIVDAHITGGVEDVGADIFERGLCLPSDNKLTEEQVDGIIALIHACFA